MTTTRTRMMEKNHLRMRLNIGLLTIEMRLQAWWIQNRYSATAAQRFIAPDADSQPK